MEKPADKQHVSSFQALMCVVGAASAFVESTLAQIYKRRDAQDADRL